MSDELAFAGAHRQAQMVKAGEVTPTELVELYLERIERIDPEINSYRVILADQARAEAKEVEQKLASGADLPMGGVPVAIKDTEDVAGEITYWGTKAFDQPAEQDGEMIRKLREAGAIIIGKTNLPELAICGFTESEGWGITRNPWDTSRTPGGSSGGSGAATAAGLCGVASASDGGGSIRIPATFNGLFGLKPQRDRISLAPFKEHWHGLSVVGCVSRTVADTALWLDVTAGGVPGGPPDPDVGYLDAANAKPAKLRIAYSTKPVRAILPPTVTDETKGAIQTAAELLRGLGHDVEARDPEWKLIGNNMTPRYLNGISEQVDQVPHPERLEKRTRGFGKLGRPLGRMVKGARRNEAKDARRILRIFDHCDVLVMPVVGEHSIEAGRWEGKSATRTLLGMSKAYPFCIPWNHLGNPAASVPMGFTREGWPLSVQIVGRPNDETTLLSLAAQIESEKPWADKTPPIA